MTPVDSIRPSIETRLDPFLLDSLKTGDINKILAALPAGVTKDDVLDFLKNQWIKYKSHIQDDQFYASYASAEECTKDKIAPVDPNFTMTSEDRAALPYMFAKYAAAKEHGVATSLAVKAKSAASGGKAVALAGAKTAEDSGEAVSPTLQDKIDADDEAFNSLLDSYQDRIFEINLNRELQAQEGEIKKEIAKLISLVQSGSIDAEDILLAIGKVFQMKNGLIGAQIGKRIMRKEEEMTKVSEAIRTIGEDGGSTDAFQTSAQLQTANTETQAIGRDVAQLTSTYQKVLSNIEGMTTFVKSGIDEIKRGKAEIVRKFTASGG